jgi:hypothetical protein
MKTAIYIEDGTVQLVLTPESEFEKSALSKFEKNPLEAKIFAGSFYDCRGGWVRQASHTSCAPLPGVHFLRGEDRSLILRVSKNPQEDTPPDYGLSMNASEFVGGFGCEAK